MTVAEIIEELKVMSMADRFVIIEAALQLIKEDLQQGLLSPIQVELYDRLAANAAALYQAYTLRSASSGLNAV